jgi:hypothetical protein
MTSEQDPDQPGTVSPCCRHLAEDRRPLEGEPPGHVDVATRGD